MSTRSRDTTTGEFVTKADAESNPAGTVTETIPAPSPIIALAERLCNALRESGDLDCISMDAEEAYDALMTALNSR